MTPRLLAEVLLAVLGVYLAAVSLPELTDALLTIRSHPRPSLDTLAAPSLTLHIGLGLLFGSRAVTRKLADIRPLRDHD